MFEQALTLFPYLYNTCGMPIFHRYSMDGVCIKMIRDKNMLVSSDLTGKHHVDLGSSLK